MSKVYKGAGEVPASGTVHPAAPTQWVDVRVPNPRGGKPVLVFRYAPETHQVQVQQRGQLNVIDLTAITLPEK